MGPVTPSPEAIDTYFADLPGIIEDISAAATGVAILVWLMVMVSEYYALTGKMPG